MIMLIFNCPFEGRLVEKALYMMQECNFMLDDWQYFNRSQFEMAKPKVRVILEA